MFFAQPYPSAPYLIPRLYLICAAPQEVGRQLLRLIIASQALWADVEGGRT